MKGTALPILLAACVIGSASPDRALASGIALTTAGAPVTELTLHGFGSMQVGQVVRGRQQEDTLKDFWLENAFVNLSLDAVYKERLRIELGVEGKESFDQINISQMKGPWYVSEKYFRFYVSQAHGTYTFGDRASTHLHIGAGIFPYKYNPDSRNLGEYLFRTGTYPGYIVTQFDMPFARLSGLRIGGAFRDLVRADLVLTSETDHRPFYDWSLSLVGAANTPRKAFEFGAGVVFDRLLSVNSKYTTPQTQQNAIVNPKDSADTVYYSFAGTKPMIRFAFRPFNLVKTRFFGPDDFKLYGEMAILGVKNYPVLYDTLSQRIPIMLGINLPAWKVLDVLSFELQWYGSHYANSYDQAQRYDSPRPDNGENMQQHSPADFLSEDEMKWSVYAKKTVLDHCSIIAQVARDHLRLDTQFEEHLDRVEALVNKGYWYWMMKVQFDL